MSDAAYRFYPWVRRGAAAHVAAPDVAATTGMRTTLPVSVTFNDDPATVAATTLELFGPGDVLGFDARTIVRVSPPPRTTDAEPNYFAAVELAEVDLPWRFTPRSEVTATARLRPWLTLLVCRDTPEEHGPFIAARPDRPVESVTLPIGTPMPPPDQLWAWCHVQVSGVDGPSLTEIIEQQPERCVARLLSPRRLDPSTAYWALLVPVFEVGRRAALRVPLGSANTLDTAWSTTTLSTALELPVFHRWRFVTGAGGDFESLARRLTPATMPSNVGARPLDVSEPGGGLPAASAAPMPLCGALQPPGAPPAEGPDPAFVSGLAEIVNVPANVLEHGGDPVVAPPLYGQWHARRIRLAPTDGPPWFQDLNRDPRTRVAAALGTAVVQAQQHELMATAWQQVDGIRDANARLRMAQLGRAASERLHFRYVEHGDDQAVLTLTAAALGRIVDDGRTVRHRVDHSPVRSATFASAMRRFSRPLGPLGRRQGRPDQAPAPVIARVNDGTYAGVLPPTPAALVAGVPTESWLVDTIGDPLPTPSNVDGAPQQSERLAWDPVLGTPPTNWPRGSGGNDSPSLAAFRAAAIVFSGRDRTPAPGGELRQLDLGTTKDLVRVATDPRNAIAAAIGSRLSLAPGFTWNPPDPLEQVMAHPVFPQAMYKPLAAASPDWILGGLAGLSPDTVTLAETNPAFIEAYMVGLNHEMSRELLWNEYPSDQRGSYFRQFWEPAGLTALPAPETAKDVTPLHLWPPLSALGSHSPRPAPQGGKHLVLVVRGELLRRYPGTLVYAQAAAKTATGYDLGTERRRPAFAGRLQPDVAFFGFALTETEVRGTGTVAEPGWFFVFEEQPHEPRFGLDVAQFPSTAPSTWADLAWSHLAASEAALATLHYIDLSISHSQLADLEVAGGPGWHLTAAGPGRPFARGADHAVITSQRPVRVALHAAQLLP